MKSVSFILFALLAASALLKASDSKPPMDEITLILWRKQTNMMAHEDRLGVRLEQLMEVIGKEMAAYRPERLAALKPEKFEDRLRLIALARVQHPEFFEEIQKTYVKRPTQEEFEKMRAEFIKSYIGNGNTPEEEVREIKEEMEKLNREHSPPPLDMPPPREIQPKHLEAKYRFCYEYFWMSPSLEDCYRHYKIPMVIALDQLKEKSGGVDMRELLEEKLKTFDPRKDPNFQILDP